MREEELRNHATCTECGKAIGHTGLPSFWTVKIERHIVDLPAIQRQDGLAAVLGGSAALARVMGPDEELTTLASTAEATLCERCATDVVSIAALSESAGAEFKGPGIKELES